MFQNEAQMLHWPKSTICWKIFCSESAWCSLILQCEKRTAGHTQTAGSLAGLTDGQKGMTFPLVQSPISRTLTKLDHGPLFRCTRGGRMPTYLIGLRPTGALQHTNTLRLWRTKDFSPLQTICCGTALTAGEHVRVRTVMTNPRSVSFRTKGERMKTKIIYAIYLRY